MISCSVIISSLISFSTCNADAQAFSSQNIDLIEKQPESLNPSPRQKAYPWMALSDWYQKHTDDVAAAELGEAEILLIGDSITEGWEFKGKAIWEEQLLPLKAVNFGIGGDMTQNLLWRLENGSTGKLQPSAVILLIGTNNLSLSNDTPEQIEKGIKAIADQLLLKFPEANLLIYGIFPRGEFPSTDIRKRIESINQEIALLDAHPRISYLDIKDTLSEPDGSLSAEIMPDFLHLSEKGYRRWAESLLPWVQATLSDRKVSR